MTRLFFMLGALFGLTGVACGAFGAHGLKERLTPDLLAVFNTGAQYQMYHALALLGAAWACGHFGGRLPVAAGWCFTAGIVIFSGSLYMLAISGVRLWGAVTPFGGLAFMAGWLCLLLSAHRAP